jgi:predicted metal-dependent phosphoesterase TrpH
MVRKGIVGSIQEAFDRYLGDGALGHVGRRRPQAAEAVRAVLGSGGLPVLAHPLRMKLAPDALRGLVGELAGLGVVGLEAYYSRHTASEREELMALAAAHGMMVTGGSDYHGTFKPDLRVGVGPGDLDVPGSVLAALSARRP